MRTVIPTLMLVTMGMALPFAAHAGTDIVIDFGSVASAPGGNVNNVTPSADAVTFTTYTSVPLKDYTSGSSTGVTVSLSATSGDFYSDWPFPYENTGSVWSGGTNSGWLADALTNDYIGSDSNLASLTVTLTGLSAGTYTLCLVSAGDSARITTSTSESISLSVGGGAATYATSEANGGSDLGAGWNLTDAGEGLNDYLIWSNLVVGDGESITITLTDTGAGDVQLVALNGLRITSVPEPAETAAFFGTLALMGAWFHRRKKTTTA